MAGFPHYALDTYLPKLIRAGLRVAICDKLETPQQKKQEEKSEGKADIKEKGKEKDNDYAVIE